MSGAALGLLALALISGCATTKGVVRKPADEPAEDARPRDVVPHPERMVRARVVDAETGQLVTVAALWFELGTVAGWAECGADSVGHPVCSAPKLPVTLRVSSPGYVPASVVVGPDENGPTVRLQRGIVISGRFVDGARAGLEGIQIRARQQGEPPGGNEQRVTTDASGRFRLTGLLPGHARLDFEWSEQRVELTPELVGIDLELPESGEVPLEARVHTER